jgi:hypothetical protein
MPNLGKAEEKKKYELQKCAVCVGMDNDKTLKPCFYCYACNEWLCDDCTPRLFGRGFLALKKLFTFK